MSSYFTKRGSKYMVGDTEDSVVLEKLPAGVYSVQFNPMGGFFFLQIMDDFTLPKKIYGNHTKDAERILNTFESRKGTSTGTLLSGEKGSGKTMLARKVSILAAKKGIPTIVVNTEFKGEEFNDFIASITQSCVVMFDEFEKVYDDESQNLILTLMDGVYQGHKLYMLTCNDKWAISSHMRNRPGRIFYFLEFDGLDEEFIREYCEDNLKNKEHVKHVVLTASTFLHFNFDMLQALVEEMNRYNETPLEALRMLNCKPERGDDSVRYDVEFEYKGKALDYKTEIRTSPLTESFTIQFPNPLYKPKKRGNNDDYDEYDDTQSLSGPRIRFTVQPGDLTMVDASKGVYVFFKNETRITLKTPPFVPFSYDRLLV